MSFILSIILASTKTWNLSIFKSYWCNSQGFNDYIGCVYCNYNFNFMPRFFSFQYTNESAHYSWVQYIDSTRSEWLTYATYLLESVSSTCPPICICALIACIAGWPMLQHPIRSDRTHRQIIFTTDGIFKSWWRHKAVKLLYRDHIFQSTSTTDCVNLSAFKNMKCFWMYSTLLYPDDNMEIHVYYKMFMNITYYVITKHSSFVHCVLCVKGVNFTVYSNIIMYNTRKQHY